MKKKLIIIGAGGHGKVIANIAKLNGYQEIAFLDDDEKKTEISTYKIIGKVSDVKKYSSEYDIIVGIGSNEIRNKVSNDLSEMGIIQSILIHPTAAIDATVSIGEGTVIMANVAINVDSRIGKSCIINTGATIDHDCVIDDFVHISPGVNIAGGVNVEKMVWLGIGSTVINNVNIREKSIIGAGGVVIENLEESGTYVGVPVKHIK